MEKKVEKMYGNVIRQRGDFYLSEKVINNKVDNFKGKVQIVRRKAYFIASVIDDALFLNTNDRPYAVREFNKLTQ